MNKEHPESIFYSEGVLETNKAIYTYRFWKKFNEIFVGLLAFLVIVTFELFAMTIMSGVSIFVSFPIEILIVLGVIFLVTLEDKAFKKLSKKIFPLAFYQ